MKSYTFYFPTFQSDANVRSILLSSNATIKQQTKRHTKLAQVKW